LVDNHLPETSPIIDHQHAALIIAPAQPTQPTSIQGLATSASVRACKPTIS
jgi:hypothetical protein